MAMAASVVRLGAAEWLWPSIRRAWIACLLRSFSLTLFPKFWLLLSLLAVASMAPSTELSIGVFPSVLWSA